MYFDDFKLKSNYLFFFEIVLHENSLTHTDLKPENILFVNSDYDIVLNQRKVCFYLSSILSISLS
jgi:serine/threonine protein kinase